MPARRSEHEIVVGRVDDEGVVTGEIQALLGITEHDTGSPIRA